MVSQLNVDEIEEGEIKTKMENFPFSVKKSLENSTLTLGITRTIINILIL